MCSRKRDSDNGIPWQGQLPPLDMPPSQWIESQWDGSPEGTFQMIEGASHGERSTLEYQQFAHSYAEVAEATAQREDIPLTRRSYIQTYFESIRR